MHWSGASTHCLTQGQIHAGADQPHPVLARMSEGMPPAVAAWLKESEQGQVLEGELFLQKRYTLDSHSYGEGAAAVNTCDALCRK